ncbi:MAG: ATP-binding cassette domain-containing protein [Lysobacterales bacterium]|nr:MAG: ATP-binding cassette domain-containing protein [Xanthomonadales bacterium]
MDAILDIEKLTTKVSGYTILKELNLQLHANELRVLLGPNGAGKTTLIDMITGRFKPTSGKIRFLGQDITGQPPDRIFRQGISRKFQVPNLYETLSVFDNIMVSLRGERRVFSNLLRKTTSEEADRMWDVLELIHLSDKANDPADTLSHGERQWLEMGMLLASGPKLLLLDEPTTGMTEDGKQQTADMIERIAEDHSVLLVEHDMHVVRKIAKTVTVMHQGQILAEGPLAEIVANETVQQIYLGKGGASAS